MINVSDVGVFLPAGKFARFTFDFPATINQFPTPTPALSNVLVLSSTLRGMVTVQGRVLKLSAIHPSIVGWDLHGPITAQT